jgi:hypothetical protein
MHNKAPLTSQTTTGPPTSKLIPYPVAAPMRHSAATAVQPTRLSRALRNSP